MQKGLDSTMTAATTILAGRQAGRQADRQAGRQETNPAFFGRSKIYRDTLNTVTAQRAGAVFLYIKV